MTNTLGPKKREHEYEIYKGKPVRVGIMSNGSAIGIVEGASSEYLSLRPSLINQGIYTLENKLISNYIFQKELPQKIKLTSISHIEPLQEGYMEHLAQNMNYVSNPPKIILP